MKIKKTIKEFLKNKKPNEEQLKDIKKIIDYCSNLYYDDEKESPLTDEEFDKLFNHYSKFKNYKAISKSSKRNKNLIDTEHNFPQLVGTLDKTNYISIEDKKNDNNPDANTVEEWFEKQIASGLISKDKKYDFYISWKLDGNSITLTYNDKGEVISALTRGKNGLGSDKTEYFKNRKLPSWFKIDKGDTVGIKYEAITTFEKKIKIEEIMKREYASPCSLVSGLLGGKDVPQKAIDLITLAPIRIQFQNKKITRKKELILISELHDMCRDFTISINPIMAEKGITLSDSELPTLNVKIYKENIKNTIKKVKEIYERFTNKYREILPYPVDGIVFEFMEEEVREKMGRSEDRNNFEFALKFPYDTKKSVVEDIEFYVSKNGTGRITPVVHFKPLKFSRAICDHVSIANYKRFKELQLAKGDSVIIQYRNDVLSYLYYDESVKHVGKPIKFISKCPMCGEPLKVNKEKTFVNCVNKKCPSIKIGRFNNYLIKLGVDSVRENTLTDLYNAGLLKSLASLYKLKVSDITKIDGYQKQSAENIINSINSKKEIFDYELLGSLGFKNIGLSTCKEICKKFTIKQLLEMVDDELSDMEIELTMVDGVAQITAKQFQKDFKKNIKTINNLMKVITVKEYKNSVNLTDNPESIVFTGFRNSDIQKKLEQAGHSIKGSVSKKTTILVTAQKGSGSVKEKKAEELGVAIYSVDEFINKILPSLI